MSHQTLYITIGLPASGKSTWAKKLIHDNPGVYKRVNKDDLRAMLDVSHWSNENEQFVLNVRDHVVGEALKQGKNVIVDDTNLSMKHQERLELLVGHVNRGVNIELILFDVSIEECIKRDSQRTGVARVGPKVIQSMAKSFEIRKAGLSSSKHKVTTFRAVSQPVVTPEPVKHDPSLPTVVIYDIDGTVAKMNHRSPFDWTRVHEDSVNEPIADIVRQYHREGCPVFAVSGRDGSCRELTENWLRANDIPFDGLFMRPAGDMRKDSLVKMEIFEKEFKGKYNIKFILDDRPSVLRMWRSLGLCTLQVGDGHEF
jgi:predicted kinase